MMVMKPECENSLHQRKQINIYIRIAVEFNDRQSVLKVFFCAQLINTNEPAEGAIDLDQIYGAIPFHSPKVQSKSTSIFTYHLVLSDHSRINRYYRNRYKYRSFAKPLTYRILDDQLFPFNRVRVGNLIVDLPRHHSITYTRFPSRHLFWVLISFYGFECYSINQ